LEVLEDLQGALRIVSCFGSILIAAKAQHVGEAHQRLRFATAVAKRAIGRQRALTLCLRSRRLVQAIVETTELQVRSGEVTIQPERVTIDGDGVLRSSTSVLKRCKLNLPGRLVGI